MTLATHVYVMSEADPREVFFECRRLLGATDAHPWHDEGPSKWSDYHVLRNRAGVGLPALLWLRYRPEAALYPDHTTHDPDICDPEDCDGRWHPPAHWIDLDFDTAYGYRDEQGRTCGVLHAQLVADLGGWFDERGIRWAWKNEFTGDVHIGDRYERLYDLFSGGDQAHVWFEDIVKPAIARAFG